MWQTYTVSTLGRRIREARDAQGISQVELSKRVGVSSGEVSRWESGGRSPRGNHLTELAHALEVTETWLMRGDGPRERGAEVRGGVLDEVLRDFVWPEGDLSDFASIERAEADARSEDVPGLTRSHSAWRVRLAQLYQGHKARSVYGARSGSSAPPPALRPHVKQPSTRPEGALELVQRKRSR